MPCLNSEMDCSCCDSGRRAIASSTPIARDGEDRLTPPTNAKRCGCLRNRQSRRENHAAQFVAFLANLFRHSVAPLRLLHPSGLRPKDKPAVHLPRACCRRRHCRCERRNNRTHFILRAAKGRILLHLRITSGPLYQEQRNKT